MRIMTSKSLKKERKMSGTLIVMSGGSPKTERRRTRSGKGKQNPKGIIWVGEKLLKCETKVSRLQRMMVCSNMIRSMLGKQNQGSFPKGETH